MDMFKNGGGLLSGATSHGHIGGKVLHGQQDCQRNIDGVGERLARELHLSDAEVFCI